MAEKKVMTAKEWALEVHSEHIPHDMEYGMSEYAKYYHSELSKPTEEVKKLIEDKYPVTEDEWSLDFRNDLFNKALRDAAKFGYSLNGDRKEDADIRETINAIKMFDVTYKNDDYSIPSMFKEVYDKHGRSGLATMLEAYTDK